MLQVVVGDVGVLAQEPFDHVAGVVEDEDRGLEPVAADLTDLLSRELMCIRLR